MTVAANVVATGRYLPERLVTNDELRQQFAGHERADVIDRFEANSGILQRYWAHPEQTTSDLALEAARQALARAGRRAAELDLILLGTDTPDHITPATSVILQAKLGATGAGTFDISCACAAFPSAMATAAGLMATNPGIRSVLVVGAYLMQRLADPTDPMVFFYGDGAGAALLERGTTGGVCASAFIADGHYADHWGIAAGGTAEPASEAAVEAGRTQVRLSKRYPPEINENGWPKVVRRLAQQGEFAPSDIAAAIFTQVNAATIDTTCTALGIKKDKAPKLMDQYGYTGSACVPIALDHLLERQQIGPGDLVTLVGSGVGYNMAGVAVRF
ncbi:3-ketoacyl-ACP synthase I [Spiribacter salinus M19-40]|jgi:3-oxoacyl-[acyl-carrier-protein] synthase-3|uniref:3-ketoacyl-ACP synthase I n=1 Tax=Spiribacter salinus M19-40 TaxID=1260251 RepID=R4VCR6_9GAMM|nr:ketoacyl-ACP synthase III [Spiribacter salinus]AGM40141.1 3-ketoacyl-ACP synthase I [Spiribacter salinus M19-40]